MSGKIQALLERADPADSSCSVSLDERGFPDAGSAGAMFSRLKKDLLDLKKWNEHSTLTGFELFDENGSPGQTDTIFQNAFLRISLKGAIKYDWVRVIEIYESADEFVITVRPTYDPTVEKPDKTVTSHFFTAESTNNFCLSKHDKTVSLYVIGLDEKQNTSETKNPLETVRNMATVNIGNFFGIQEGEWTAFCKNFLSSGDSR